MSKFYITNAIPYVNAKPHIGHALEFVQSDVIARYHKLITDDVLLLCGGDENALKNVQAAEKQNMPIQTFVDTHSDFFLDLAKKLHVQFDIFQKGSDVTHHFTASQILWEKCMATGDIYKKSYKGLYCVGCEQFYTLDELDERGECFEHPGKKLTEVEEENYFFKLSRYQDKILEILQDGTLSVVPDFRKNEVIAFVKRGLQDISISRSNERAKNWGVPVPKDSSQRMYVWFDALNIYQSGIGFGWDEAQYNKWWPADVHVIGKGIVRFHAVYWPAFLLSAGLKLPKKIFVHEYFTVNGQKMSKTLGNVIDPFEMIEKYGPEALRFYFMRHFSPFSDGDFSETRLQEVYNADLANGLGNVTGRIAKLCQLGDYKRPGTTMKKSLPKEYGTAMEEFRFNDAVTFIWQKITQLDRYINEQKPWELVKEEKTKLAAILTACIDHIQEIAVLLTPFMPETAESIAEQFKGPEIILKPPLFPRKI